MRTAAETQVRRPSAVRVLTILLATTAAATVVVELLNWWYAPEQGFGLAVRTGWAMLRSFGFLLLIGHVRRGRAGGPPVRADPRGHHDLRRRPADRAAAGGAAAARPARLRVLTALCVAVVWLLYRSPAVARAPRPAPPPPGHRPARHLLAGGAAAPTAGQRLAADQPGGRVHLQPADAGAGPGGLGPSWTGGWPRVPAVLLWFGAGDRGQLRGAVLHRVFLMRGKDWARGSLVVVTVAVLAGGPAAVLVAAGPGRPGPRRRPAARRGRADPLRPAPRFRADARTPALTRGADRRAPTAADPGYGSRDDDVRRGSWSAPGRPGPPPRWPRAGPAPACCCSTGPTSRATRPAATASPRTRSTCSPGSA